MAVAFAVRLTPRGGVDRIEGVDEDGLLRVRVRAIPEAGAANAALRRLVAADLDLAPSAIRLLAGQRGRVKRLAIAGVGVAALRQRWPGLVVVDARGGTAG